MVTFLVLGLIGLAFASEPSRLLTPQLFQEQRADTSL